jgi:hypothetical protein
MPAAFTAPEGVFSALTWRGRAASDMTANLADLRVQIDALDRELLALLNRRAQVAEQVGEVKNVKARPSSAPTGWPR